MSFAHLIIIEIVDQSFARANSWSLVEYLNIVLDLVVAGLAVAVTVGTGIDCIAVLQSTPVPNSNSGAAD
jgi:hypothetical protein